VRKARDWHSVSNWESSAVADLRRRGKREALPRGGSALPGVAVGDAPEKELLDAVIRMLRLLDHPRDQVVLVPLLKREILWYLLRGEHGAIVGQLGLAEGGPGHMVQAVRWLRVNYAQPLRAEHLPQLSGMDVSACHRGFQAVTAMSPAQYQNLVRLHEARPMPAAHSQDVVGVAHRVGYDSAAQFSRDYRHRFGAAPGQDSADPCHPRAQPPGRNGQ
jgi:AraC-like DNA-binding protein